MRLAEAIGPVVWEVAFTGFEVRTIVDRLSPEGFRHVLAYGYDVDAGVWLVYDPTLTHTTVAALDTARFVRWQARLIDEGATILRCPVVSEARFRGRIGFWCTTSIKHLLGLRCSAFRPVGLYRYLRRAGCEVVHGQGQGEAAEGIA